jgi:hypothetical protein
MRLQQKHTIARPLERVMGSFTTMNSAGLSGATADASSEDTPTRLYAFPSERGDH